MYFHASEKIKDLFCGIFAFRGMGVFFYFNFFIYFCFLLCFALYNDRPPGLYWQSFHLSSAFCLCCDCCYVARTSIYWFPRVSRGEYDAINHPYSELICGRVAVTFLPWRFISLNFIWTAAFKLFPNNLRRICRESMQSGCKAHEWITESRESTEAVALRLGQALFSNTPSLGDNTLGPTQATSG